MTDSKPKISQVHMRKSSIVVKSTTGGLGDRKSIAALDKSMNMSRLHLRKHSFGFSGVPGIRPIEKTSQLGIEFKRPPLLYLNTFRLDPTSKFHKANVFSLVEAMLDEHFNGHKYNTSASTGLSIRLANELLKKIKAMCFFRYRIITIVSIGQKRAQSYNNAISFLWDHERDMYVNTQREESTAFIQVTVVAIYLD